jgi:hypothetical protein
MAKLKLGLISEDKPVKITIEITAAVQQDLIAYANALGKQTGQTITDPTKLIVPMLTRFMNTDRAFKKAKHCFVYSAEAEASPGNWTSG